MKGADAQTNVGGAHSAVGLSCAGQIIKFMIMDRLIITDRPRKRGIRNEGVHTSAIKGPSVELSNQGVVSALHMYCFVRLAVVSTLIILLLQL